MHRGSQRPPPGRNTSLLLTVGWQSHLLNHVELLTSRDLSHRGVEENHMVGRMNSQSEVTEMGTPKLSKREEKVTHRWRRQGACGSMAFGTTWEPQAGTAGPQPKRKSPRTPLCLVYPLQDSGTQEDAPGMWDRSSFQRPNPQEEQKPPICTLHALKQKKCLFPNVKRDSLQHSLHC